MAVVRGQVFDLTLNDSTLVGMFQKVNSFTDVGHGGIFGIFILIVFAAALFLMMKTFGFERSLTVTMLITSVVGLLLKVIGLIGSEVFYVCVVLLIVGVIFLIIDAEKYS